MDLIKFMNLLCGTCSTYVVNLYIVTQISNAEVVTDGAAYTVLP